MVRPINLNLSDEIYRQGKETAQIISRGEYKGLSFPEIILQFTEKIVNKRIELAGERIQKYLDEQADELFDIMLEHGIDQTQNNFPLSYGGKAWRPLSKKWVKYKLRKWGNKNFWIASGDLSSWLSNTSNKPTDVFGRPKIYTTANPKARGYQWGNFYIDLFPKLENPNFNNELIRYKLFGRRKTGAMYISNDQDRPIVIPAIVWLIRKRIRRGIMTIFKEAVENG